jgi:hypothetical protein
VVEGYVRCPRSGLVPLARCEACDLLQGTLRTERLEVLCAYPEAHPALSATHARGGDDDSQGAPPTLPAGERRDAALALAAPAGPSRHVAAARGRLIFDTDWPDE